MPIGIGLYQYQTIDTNAIELGLISQGTDSLYYDVGSRPRSPYNINNTFVAAISADSIPTGTSGFMHQKICGPCTATKS